MVTILRSSEDVPVRRSRTWTAGASGAARSRASRPVTPAGAGRGRPHSRVQRLAATRCRGEGKYAADHYPRPMSDTLPMFPLNTVLFPGMSVPLRVFED